MFFLILLSNLYYFLDVDLSIENPFLLDKSIKNWKDLIKDQMDYYIYMTNDELLDSEI